MTDLHALFDDLVRVEILLWDAVDGHLRRELGLPLGRIQALRAIGGRPDCRVQDVADALAVTVGAVSKLVDRLEAGGLCVRRANPADRRSSIIEATAAGRDVLARAQSLVDAKLRACLATTPPDELAGLAALLAGARKRLI